MGSHGYARVEHERRFLLRELPSPLTPSSYHALCTDLYLEGQRLRLRSFVPSDGGPAEYKLGQKHRREGMGPDQREMTTLYLTLGEHAFLAARLGVGVEPLVKRRYPLEHGGVRYSVDVFEGRCAGLVLADLELVDGERLRRFGLPPFASREVTDDPRYEGGTLARLGAPAVE
jgi:hypothetical protein